MHNVKTVDLHADDAAWDAAGLGKGDLVHLETPINPTGEAFSIDHFAKRAHARGALLLQMGRRHRYALWHKIHRRPQRHVVRYSGYRQ
jgi:hypothetical protein